MVVLSLIIYINLSLVFVKKKEKLEALVDMRTTSKLIKGYGRLLIAGKCLLTFPLPLLSLFMHILKGSPMEVENTK